MSIVPVLCYHGIGDAYPKADRAFAFSVDAFRRHLDLFARRRLRTVTVAQLAEARRAGRDDELEGTVAITFDDGYADLLSVVLPELVARDLVATAFVTTGHVSGRDEGRAGHDRWLSTPELRALAASGRVEIGGHGHDHLPLDQLPLAAADAQLRRCRDELAARLGAPPATFAYPFGYSTPEVRRAVAAAGFVAAAGVKHARSGPRDDLFDLCRVRLLPRHEIADLADFLDGRRLRLGPCPEELRTRLYRPVRVLRGRLRPPQAS